jgi:hypothetical protein
MTELAMAASAFEHRLLAYLWRNVSLVSDMMRLQHLAGGVTALPPSACAKHQRYRNRRHQAKRAGLASISACIGRSGAGGNDVLDAGEVDGGADARFTADNIFAHGTWHAAYAYNVA